MMSTTANPNELIDPTTLSRELGVPEGTLSNWRYGGTGPIYIKVGNAVRYRRSDLDAWLDKHTVVTKP